MSAVVEGRKEIKISKRKVRDSEVQYEAKKAIHQCIEQLGAE
jgi:hypothetical protein